MTKTFTPLDCGGGRRLDDAGGILIDRPSPAATNPKSADAPWEEAHFHYTGKSMNQGEWRRTRELPPALVDALFGQRNAGTSLVLPPLRISGLVVEPRLSPSGQIGIFSEQETNWRFLASARLQRKLKLLHLFAYTGLSTLAALRGGHSITHLDAAKSVVRWAKRNAELSGMAESPVRWIADDAMRFCKRELRRGISYEGFVLDPPAFGRGPKKESWKIERDLPKLLGLLSELCQNQPRLILLSAHHTAWNENTLKELLCAAFPGLEKRGRLRSYPLTEGFSSGASLSCGYCVLYVSGK